MSPEKITVALLAAHAPLTALVGTRIYPRDTSQKNTAPFIIYELISDVALPPINATSGPNIYVARVQVNCLGSTYTEARTVGAAVRDAMHLAYGTIAGVQVVSVSMALRGPDLHDPSLGVFINPLDFSITYQE